MAFDVEAARAEGYSDEDIEKYLASIGQTMTGETVAPTQAVAPQQPMDRSNEYMGMGQAAALGTGAALAGKALVFDPIKRGVTDMVKSAFAPGPVAPQGAPAPQAQQSMTNKIRQIAAQRIAGFGASPAAVPAGVALGGAAATGVAGGQMAAMTPEQRKAYYDSMMMGAMSGDAGLAAAIMNRGQ